MNRRDFFYRQLVAEADLDEVFDLAEQADQALMTDLGHVGILDGLDISEAGVPDLTVECDAGVAYDQDGQRMYVSSLQTVNVAVDKDAVSTDVANPGNKKWLSVFLKFKRVLSNPKTDGNNVTVQYNRAESFEFIVEQSAEDVAPSRPALKADAILLADIERSEGVTTVTNANIDVTRRQWAISVSSGAFAVGEGQVEPALQAVMAYFNTLYTGTNTFSSNNTLGGSTTLAGAVVANTSVDWLETSGTLRVHKRQNKSTGSKGFTLEDTRTHISVSGLPTEVEVVPAAYLPNSSRGIISVRLVAVKEGDLTVYSAREWTAAWTKNAGGVVTVTDGTSPNIGALFGSATSAETLTASAGAITATFNATDAVNLEIAFCCSVVQP